MTDETTQKDPQEVVGRILDELTVMWQSFPEDSTERNLLAADIGALRTLLAAKADVAGDSEAKAMAGLLRGLRPRDHEALSLQKYQVKALRWLIDWGQTE